MPAFLEPRGVQRTGELGSRHRWIGTGKGPLMVMSIMLSGHCRGVAWDGQGNEILEHHSPMTVNSWKVIEPFPRGGIWELRNKLVVREGRQPASHWPECGD